MACQLGLSPPLCVRKRAMGQVSHAHTLRSRLPSDLCFSWCVLQSPCSAGISWHKAPKATAFLLDNCRANPQIYLSSYDACFLLVSRAPLKGQFTQKTVITLIHFSTFSNYLNIWYNKFDCHVLSLRNKAALRTTFPISPCLGVGLGVSHIWENIWYEERKNEIYWLRRERESETKRQHIFCILVKQTALGALRGATARLEMGPAVYDTSQEPSDVL